MANICFWADGGWCPDDLIGGSEQCVVGLARTLAARGHVVDVVNGHRVPIVHDKVLYTHSFDHALPLGPYHYDLLICQRSYQKVIDMASGNMAKKVALWCHDINVQPHFPQTEIEIQMLIEAVDKVVVLNNHHRNLYSAVPDSKIAVIPIGVDQPVIPEGTQRDPYRCVTIYHPNRGLDTLRAFWPEIRRQVPQATLHSFWWEPEQFRPANESIGIMPMRALKQSEVPIELAKSGVFGYFSCFNPEISPASLINAQIRGCVPVTVNKGGMNDVMYYGEANSPEFFVSSMIKILTNHEYQNVLRSYGMVHVGNIHSWDRCAASFEGLL